MMRWIRVKIHDMSRLNIPHLCPNCLDDGELVDTPIVRSTGVPFGVAITTTSSWPFCKRCAEWTRHHSNWQKWYAIGLGGLLAALALIIAVMTNDRGMHPSAGWLLLAAIVVAIGGCFVASFIQMFSLKPEGCLSNFPTVKPISGGKAIFSKRITGVYDFTHPVYVAQLVQLNYPETVKVNEKTLKRAMADYQKQIAEMT